MFINFCVEKYKSRSFYGTRVMHRARSHWFLPTSSKLRSEFQIIAAMHRGILLRIKGLRHAA